MKQHQDTAFAHVKTATADYGKGIKNLGKVAQSMLDADMVLFPTESIAEIKQHVTRYTALLHTIQKIWPAQIKHLKASTMTEGMGMLTTDTWQLKEVARMLSAHVEKVRAKVQAANKEKKQGCTETRDRSEQDCSTVQGGRRRGLPCECAAALVRPRAVRGNRECDRLPQRTDHGP